MDDEPMVTSSKVKGEAANKIKDGYVQLAEKMEQVKNQVAKMERKYDELYQTVKEKEQIRNSNVASSDRDSPEESKTQRENAVASASAAKAAAPEEPAPAPAASEKPEESQKRKNSDLDLEKMEDNPFL